MESCLKIQAEAEGWDSRKAVRAACRLGMGGKMVPWVPAETD